MSSRSSTAAELLVASRLLHAGLVPSKVFSVEPFDLVVLRGQRALKLQVKSSISRRSAAGGCQFCVQHNSGFSKNKAKYTKDQVDFFVLVISASSDCYVIPFDKVNTFTIYVNPNNPKCPWLPYLNRWDLLTHETNTTH